MTIPNSILLNSLKIKWDKAKKILCLLRNCHNRIIFLPPFKDIFPHQNHRCAYDIVKIHSKSQHCRFFIYCES